MELLLAPVLPLLRQRPYFRSHAPHPMRSSLARPRGTLATPSRHEGWPVTLTSERAQDVCDNDVESLTGSTLPVVLWLCASQRYTTHPECRPV